MVVAGRYPPPVSRGDPHDDQRLRRARHDLRPLRARRARGGRADRRRHRRGRRPRLRAPHRHRHRHRRWRRPRRRRRGRLRGGGGMTASAKLTGFAVPLAVLCGGGALAGAVINPDRTTKAGGHAGEEMDMTSADEHPVRGLAVADHGLRLVALSPELPRNRAATLRFKIVDDRDRTVRDFDVEHTKRMHLIVARRDLTGFQHLHPRQAADGTWSTPVRVTDAGSYRMFADFSRDDEPVTLAPDLRVAGAADLVQLPAPAPTATSDGGYEVRLDAGRVSAGREADLRFAITKDGRTIEPEPYLGAQGHLVALREGDMAFLHVHPGEKGYMATFPTAGRYRLFLQFKDAGRVQTAAFTLEVR